ncbi:MAG: hypothetical protein QMD09_08955, partial [Desulfatibacillaceae bacterium]|nr:hypothetical protein [Desulfatibacillaceae bacterium]
GIYWIPEIDGTMRLGSSVAWGTEMDVSADLDYGSDGIMGVEAFLDLGKHRFSATYSFVEYSSDVRLKRDIIYGGVLFAKGRQVNSRMDIKMFDLEYAYKFLQRDKLWFLPGASLRLIGDLKVVDAEHHLATSTGTVKGSYRPAVPLVGMGGRIELFDDILALDVRGVGMAYSGNLIIDSQAEILLTPVSLISISAGYRFFKLDTDHDDTYTDFDLSGLYFTAGVSF